MTDEQISEAIEQHVLRYIIAGPYVADNRGRFVRFLDDPRPNYCDDAMVGWLLRWLAGEGLKPKLLWHMNFWAATVFKRSGWIVSSVHCYHEAHIQPGRALCLAVLKAHGVDVGRETV